MNEKRNLRFKYALPTGVCALAILAGCNRTGNAAASGSEASADSIAATEQTFATDSITFTDSIRTPGGCKAVCTISVGYPSDNESPATDSIRGWIAASLATDSYVSDGSTPAPYAVNADLRDNGPKLIRAVSRKVLDAARSDLLGIDSLNIDPRISYEYMWSIFPMYETGKFVTFGCSTYAYLGGAHGSSAFNARVFSLPDGITYGWNMFRNDALEKLRRLVENGIRTQYFQSSTDQEFRDCLMLPSGSTQFPLPTSAPYFMPDGVHFDYQQYEIAAYAAGMPSCVIPYSEAKPLLTPAAAALLDTRR